MKVQVSAVAESPSIERNTEPAEVGAISITSEELDVLLEDGAPADYSLWRGVSMAVFVCTLIAILGTLLTADRTRTIRFFIFLLLNGIGYGMSIVGWTICHFAIHHNATSQRKQGLQEQLKKRLKAQETLAERSSE